MTAVATRTVQGGGSSEQPTGRQLRDAFGMFATGVTIVTGVSPDGEPVGITANSFTSLSLDPPLILWCLDNKSRHLPAFATGLQFAVHMLAHDQRELALHFARRGQDKFQSDTVGRDSPRPPQLPGAVCRLDCQVHCVHPGGDHIIIVGEVHGVHVHSGRPLAFFAGLFGRFTAEHETPAAAVWEALHGEWM